MEVRHTYQLQTETIKVLCNHKCDIAAAMDVSDRYIGAILQGTETDPFAKFIELYRAAVRAGAPTQHWEDRITEERELHIRGNTSLTLAAQTYAKESADVSVAAIGNDPHAVLREAREAIAAGKRLEHAALNEIEKHFGKPSLAPPAEVRAYKNGGAR